MSHLEEEKQLVSREAVKLIVDGMIVGLGTGSTVRYFLEELALKVKQGLKITGIPTSLQTESVARKLGIPLDLEVEKVDIDVDGTDVVDGKGTLIKGGGGALFREKIVAYASKKLVVIADSTKFHENLFSDIIVPVEILSFGHNITLGKLSKLGCEPALRDKGNFLTDNGNMVADCKFKRIDDASVLDSYIKLIPGVVETGIFPKAAHLLIYAKDGSVKKKEFKATS